MRGLVASRGLHRDKRRSGSGLTTWILVVIEILIRQWPLCRRKRRRGVGRRPLSSQTKLKFQLIDGFFSRSSKVDWGFAYLRLLRQNPHHCYRRFHLLLRLLSSWPIPIPITLIRIPPTGGGVGVAEGLDTISGYPRHYRWFGPWPIFFCKLEKRSFLKFSTEFEHCP